MEVIESAVEYKHRGRIRGERRSMQCGERDNGVVVGHRRGRHSRGDIGEDQSDEIVLGWVGQAKHHEESFRRRVESSDSIDVIPKPLPMLIK
jgi:hypothetical protein